MLKRVTISSNDFSLFDAELNSYEYEYFCKHIGAFRRFMQEEPKEQKQLFLNAFCEYSYNHVEIKAIATMSDPKKKFIESFRQYVQETFINGRFSAAKQFLNDSVIVARNKHMIQYMDSHSYAKDPFFHKETRDVFRRLFGEPTEAGTCVKVICVLPLYVRFAGSICRYLKRWLDMEELLYPMPVKGKKSKAEKKALKEQALAAANAVRTLATLQQTKPAIRKSAPTSQRSLGAVGSSKTVPATGQQSKTAGSSSKTTASDEASKAIVPKPEDNNPTQAELDAAEDFSNFYFDLHERKQRKRDIRKKGKKHEHIACQHPCHGKVCNCNPHKHVHTHDHGHDHAHDHGHDHAQGHSHDHHQHEQPQATREQLMNCLCERHKAMAEAKIAEKRAAIAKKQSEMKKLEDKSSEEDKSSGDKIPEDEISVVKTSENESSEDKSPDVESSKIYEKNSEKQNSNTEGTGSSSSENKMSEDANSVDNTDNQSLEGLCPKDEKPGEDKDSGSKSSEGDKNLEDKSSEDKSSENKSSEDKSSESKEFDEKAEGNTAKEPEVKSPRGKKSHKRIHENGVVSSDESSDCDAGAVDRFVRRTFPELHLLEPHPNQQYKQMIADEKAEKEKLKESKLRTCAFCRKQETEVKTFKKCQKCKGKGTKFYCSRECQKMDWEKHRLEH